MFSQIVKSVFRSTLQRASLFDKQPILKSSISLQSFNAYYENSQDKNRKEREFCQELITRFLDGKSYYNFHKSMIRFIQEVMHQPVFQEDIEFRLGVLIRMTDYMDHQIQFLRDKKYVDLQPDSVIPVPRDQRLLYDSVHPSLANSPLSSYSGVLLLQNPSQLIQMAQNKEDPETINMVVRSSIMCPLTRIHHTYQTVFISDSQPPSRFSLSIKESLLSTAAELGLDTPVTASSSSSSSSSSSPSSSRRRAATLDATLQEELDHIVVPSRSKNALQTLREREKEETETLSDRYCLSHVVLGTQALDPVVLVDPISLPEGNALPSLPVTPSLVATRSYARTLAMLSEGKEKTQAVPLCAEISLRCGRGELDASDDRIAKAVKDGELIPVTVESFNGLLFDNGVDRRTIYPNLLKRLGGELALCADAVYKVIMGMCFVC
ncbi:hypothetical protein WA588_005231 [Blastocystis sp. NMH]